MQALLLHIESYSEPYPFQTQVIDLLATGCYEELNIS